MTIVPKKKSDTRPANAAAAAAGPNKQGQVVVDSENIVVKQQQQPDEEKSHPEGDLQQQQQQQEPTQNSVPSLDSVGLVNSMPSVQDAGIVDYTTDYTNNNNNNNSPNSADGDSVEHTHEHRRHQPQHLSQQQNPHSQHRHHHHHHHHHNKYANSKVSDNESNVNHVILITVLNAHYPITCDLIHQICSTHGKVNRIVIFKKNGVQAMVEFDSVESAKRAKSMLNGCDIYSGCCTLKLEFAKPTKLNVHKNDSDSFDYTNPNLGSGQSSNPHGSSEPGPSESSSQQHHPHTTNHSSQHGGHSAYVQGQTSGPNHRGPGMIKRGGAVVGGDVIGSQGSSSSAHNQHHHHTNQFHLGAAHVQPLNHGQQHINSKHQSALGSGQHHTLPSTSYLIGQPGPDQSASSNTDVGSSFHHQDGGFSLSRSGASGGSSGADSFMATSAGSSAHHMNLHGMHASSLYPRQDGPNHPHHHHPGQSHYQQSHHQHTRATGASNDGSQAGGGRGQHNHLHHHSHHAHHNSPSFPIGVSNSLMAGASHMAPQGTVMMVYGLGVERINCDRLFNLFCLYGNVVRIKFLRSKEGCAMVQMGDDIAIDRCVSSLNKITLFGNEMQISYSKQPFLHDVVQPFTLPDGSPSFKDFMVNKNNRFRNPEVAIKNKILPPSRILHFFNAPYGISDDELTIIFKQTAGHEPVALKVFTPKGLVTFRDPTEATEALALCNHMSLPKAGAPHPYILRLCFSPPAH